MKKIPVGILGATGSVGQKFVELLSDHPWFEIVAVAASEQSAGKRYKDAANWFMTSPIPSRTANLKVQLCEPSLSCRVVFSALDASVAGEIETKFAEAGCSVLSNARNHRMDENVPLLVPEINPEHLALIKKQKSKGKIITNPNCSTIGLALALKPLQDRFGVKQVHVVTLQAVSGAGYPGVASLDILDNAIPFIKGEEEKMASEPLKILGKLSGGAVRPAKIRISAQCNRVAVLDGHLECVSLKLAKPATAPEIIRVWSKFTSLAQKLKLPMAPRRPLRYFREERFPQPRLHRNLDKGMAVSLGRLQKCAVLDFKFVLLSHNTMRGAAAGAILNAELMWKKGIL